MRIRCWGSRGSIPVSGSCYDRYGGDTTCMEIWSEKGELVIVDAGSGLRRLGDKLEKEGVRRFDMLFTHAHVDHMMGFPFFTPIYHKETRAVIHGNPFSVPSYQTILKGFMTAPYCPVEFTDLPATVKFDKIGTRPFSLGSLRITPIPLSHPNGGMGFRFDEGNRSFVFLTDNELEYDGHPTGLSFDDYVEVCKGADLLIHDAEYTARDYKRSWGHSTVDASVRLALKAGVRRLGLFHINQRRTDAQVDQMARSARTMIARAQSVIRVDYVGSTFRCRLS